MKRTLLLLLCVSVLTCAACAVSEHPDSPNQSSSPTTAQPSPSALPVPSPFPSPAPSPSPSPTPVPEISPTPATEPPDDTLVRIRDYLPEVRVALAYATEDNFTGKQIYDFTDAYLRYGTVKKLAAASAELAEMGLGILIWDAFRPVSAQARLWEVFPDPAYVSPPGTGYRAHCRGSAVDLTLVELATGNPLVMPTKLDDFSPLADRDYSDCAADAAENALLLEQIMVRCGFSPYEAEWWHYADTVEYPIEEGFDPSAPQ